MADGIHNRGPQSDYGNFAPPGHEQEARTNSSSGGFMDRVNRGVRFLASKLSTLNMHVYERALGNIHGSSGRLDQDFIKETMDNIRREIRGMEIHVNEGLSGFQRQWQNGHTYPFAAPDGGRQTPPGTPDGQGQRNRDGFNARHRTGDVTPSGQPPENEHRTDMPRPNVIHEEVSEELARAIVKVDQAGRSAALSALGGNSGGNMHVPHHHGGSHHDDYSQINQDELAAQELAELQEMLNQQDWDAQSSHSNGHTHVPPPPRPATGSPAPSDSPPPRRPPASQE